MGCDRTLAEFDCCFRRASSSSPKLSANKDVNHRNLSDHSAVPSRPSLPTSDKIVSIAPDSAEQDSPDPDSPGHDSGDQDSPIEQDSTGQDLASPNFAGRGPSPMDNFLSWQTVQPHGNSHRQLKKVCFPEV